MMDFIANNRREQGFFFLATFLQGLASLAINWRPYRAGTRWPSLLVLAVTLFVSGCNRQDAERLGRIGAKMSAHAKSSSGELGAKMDRTWPGKEPTLQEKIQHRLTFDKALGDVKFEIIIKDKEVELKGTVHSPAQRQRAIELAETVAGVERVIDAVTLKEPDEAKKNPD